MAKNKEPDLTLNEERLNLLAQVASMYYEDNLTQHEISVQLGYSRSAISRLLTEARRAGVVEIRVYQPLGRSSELEQALRERYDLRDARVLTSNALPYPRMLRRLGELAARYVEKVVKEDDLLGVSWGTSVYEVANALRPPYYPEVMVVQMIGALGTADPQIDGPELARWIAQRYGGRYKTMPAPLIVDTPEIRDALMRDRRVSEVLDLAGQSNVALVGIGTTDPEMSSMVRAGYLAVDEIKEVASFGAVGDVCGLLFSPQGELLDIPLARRVVGIQPDTLRRIPLVVGVAGRKVKAPAILGALRARLVNVIITDDITAQAVLKLDHR
ncbi:MAG: sugar-binding domain-containing protein [Anaerolineae bacterium]